MISSPARPSFVAGTTSVWAANVSGSAGFDTAPDGQRLVIKVPAAARGVPSQEHTIGFVQNLTDIRALPPVHLLSSAVQLTTMLMGDGASPIRVLTRNR